MNLKLSSYIRLDCSASYQFSLYLRQTVNVCEMRGMIRQIIYSIITLQVIEQG